MKILLSFLVSFTVSLSALASEFDPIAPVGLVVVADQAQNRVDFIPLEDIKDKSAILNGNPKALSDAIAAVDMRRSVEVVSRVSEFDTESGTTAWAFYCTNPYWYSYYNWNTSIWNSWQTYGVWNTSFYYNNYAYQWRYGYNYGAYSYNFYWW